MPLANVAHKHPGFEADEPTSASAIFRAKSGQPAKAKRKALTQAERPRVGQPGSIADHGVLGGVELMAESVDDES